MKLKSIYLQWLLTKMEQQTIVSEAFLAKSKQ